MRFILILGFLLSAYSSAQEEHNHPNPEKLGTVSFPISCQPGTQQQFNRAVALLHSFAYRAAEESFRSVSDHDSHCAIAHWGVAMTQFHQLWEPHLSPEGISIGQKEMAQALSIESAASARERGFIRALNQIFQDASTIPYNARASKYEAAMREVADANRKDIESQVFYALALISNAPATDEQHQKQKQAADLLEPLWRPHPHHPGIPHYLIHAYDNQELAARGLQAARAYADIAPSAPHALHMPSHIFTRLGLWSDSITSNMAARNAAHQQGDVGEELHAMDYLVYAYLQSGRDEEAAEVIRQLKSMPNLNFVDFKIGYAATAIPIRYMVERQQWGDAEKVADPPGSAPPHVLAIAVWARGLGFARNGKVQQAEKESEALHKIAEQVRASGNDYWAVQVSVMEREVAAWSAQAASKPENAAAILGNAGQ